MLFTCFTCHKEFERKPSEITNKEHPFCSKSCAATTNNKLAKKRPRTKKCRTCDSLITSNLTYCRPCLELFDAKRDVSKLTIAEASYSNKWSSNRYTRIRDNARKLHYHKGAKCSRCGYNKHVEVCHIVAIGCFPVDTLVSVVNAADNIYLLCPNCHWEFDHGLLTG